jgi:hypothetical protein
MTELNVIKLRPDADGALRPVSIPICSVIDGRAIIPDSQEPDEHTDDS